MSVSRKLSIGPCFDRTVLLLLCITSSVVTNAQELISNGSFEQSTQFPSNVGQWDFCVGWTNAGGSGASPDYLHALGSGQVSLPNSVFATVSPSDGDAIMGFATRHNSTANFREYISTQFQEPMVIGASYDLSFAITNGISSQYCGNSCDRMGVRFSVGPLAQIGSQPLGGVPHLEIPGELWATDWEVFTFTFQADQPYDHFTIGNFYTDAETSTSFQTSGTPCCYYMVDEMSVILSNLGWEGDTMICVGENTTLTALSDPPHGWALETSPTVIISTDASITVSPTITTTYLHIGIDTTAITVHVIAPPQVDLGNDTSFCDGNSILLDAYDWGSTYLWSDNSTDSALTAASSGTFWVVVSNECGTASDTIDIEMLPLPFVDLGNDTLLCQGSILELDATNEDATYVWHDGSTSPTYTVDTMGTITVSVTNSCSTATDNIFVTFLAPPEIHLGSDTLICADDAIAVDVDGSANEVVWSDGSTGPVLNIESPGTYWVDVSNECGTNSDTIAVGELSPFQVDLGDDISLCQNGSVILDAGTALGSILWSTGSSGAQIEVIEEDQYWVNVNHPCGSSSDTIVVTVIGCDPVLEMPNVFSPNGDGSNDRFIPIISEHLGPAKFMIYNKWGLLVFTSNDVTAGWNGRHDGEPCSEGTYYWIVEFAGDERLRSQHGHLTLLR